MKQLQIALRVVNFAQPVNHRLAVFEVDLLYTLYIHCSYYVIPVYMSKQDTISKVYNDLAGYGSLQQTLQDAREVDPSIRLDDVRQWMTETTRRGNSSSKAKTALWLTGLIINTNKI